MLNIILMELHPEKIKPKHFDIFGNLIHIPLSKCIIMLIGSIFIITYDTCIALLIGSICPGHQHHDS